MAGATPLPRVGEVFFDDRGEDRVLRLSWHPDAEVMVLSIWNGGACTGTFRLAARDVPVLMETLSQGVPVPQPRGRRHAAPADDEPTGRPPAPAEPNPYTYPDPDPAAASPPPHPYPEPDPAPVPAPAYTYPEPDPAAVPAPPYPYPEPDPAAVPAPAPPWPPPQQTFPMTGEYRAPRHRS